jgi:hypothetical protein
MGDIYHIIAKYTEKEMAKSGADNALCEDLANPIPMFFAATGRFQRARLILK